MTKKTLEQRLALVEAFLKEHGIREYCLDGSFLLQAEQGIELSDVPLITLNQNDYYRLDPSNPFYKGPKVDLSQYGVHIETGIPASLMYIEHEGKSYPCEDFSFTWCRCETTVRGGSWQYRVPSVEMIEAYKKSEITWDIIGFEGAVLATVNKNTYESTLKAVFG